MTTKKKGKMIFLDSLTTKFVKTRLFFLIAKLALLACAIKKANLLKYIFFFPRILTLRE